MITEKNIEDVLHRVLESRRGVEAEIHAKHHQWIEEQIAAQKSRNDMRREVAKAVAQWSVIGLLGWLLTHLGVGVENKP